MTRLSFAVLLLAALALPAGAVDNNFFNWHTFRRFDYQETPTGDPWGLMFGRWISGTQVTPALVPRDSSLRWCGNLRWGPPGHQNPVLPFSDLWLFAAVETLPGALPDKDTVSILVEARWRTWYPGDYSRIYQGPWHVVLNITRAEALTYGPVMGGDTLGWFGDVEFRARGTADNDHSILYLGATRRTWK